MKGFFVFLILIISNFCLFGQIEENLAQSDLTPVQNPDRIQQQLNEMLHIHGLKKAVDPFEVYDHSLGIPGMRNIVEDASFVRLKSKEVNQIIQQKPKTLTLPITLGDGQVLELLLYEKSVFSKDAVIRTSDGQVFVPQSNVHYRGVVKDHEGSLVGISFFEDEVIGVISTRELGSIVIGLVEGQKEIHVIYRTDHLEAPEDYTCGVQSENQDPDELPNDNKRGGARSLDDCIRVYLEADYALRQNKGGTQQVINYVTGIFNNVMIIYNNEDIMAEISEIFVWTTPDSYSIVSASAALGQFRSARQNFNGNLAHLFALGGNGLGGIAYVNVLCYKPNAFAYSNISSSYQNYPTYSWTIMVVTHEMGHNVGSNHTHWCGWQGGAIDNCYAVEGNCQPGPAPSGGGTVMSYCHLTNHGINLTKGFGPLPGNLIRTRVQSANCLYQCANSCESLTADFDITHTSCNYSNGILEITPSGGSAPYMFNIGNGFTQQNIFTNLEPGLYDIVVIDDNDCEVEYEIEIYSSVRPVLNISSIHTSCGEENGLIEINVIQGNAPYEYNIGFGPTNQNLFYDLPGGTYNVLVTDIEGCSATEVVVIDPSEHLLADLVIQNTSCGNNNGRVTVNAQGGTTPYSYTYNGVYRQSNIFDSLPAGNYTFEVVDFYGCIFMVPGMINGSIGILATSSSIPASCGGANGSITVTVTQGVTPYTYRLNGNSQSSNVFTGLASGVYTVIVTDSTGCTKAVQSTVGTSGTLSLSSEVEHAYCEMNQGRIEVLPLNGSRPFEYDFGGGFQAENYIEQLSSGTYEVDVRDSLGCEGSINVIIESSPTVDLSAVSTPATCVVNNGTVLITGIGGSIPYTYILGSQESNMPLFEDLSAGMYIAGVRDSVGCEAMVIIEVESATGMTVDIETEDANCGESGGRATATASGGSAPYSYNIGEGAQSNGFFTDLQPGIYDLVAIDAIGCTYNTFFEIEGFGTIVIEVIETDPTTCGLSNGSANFGVSGGNGQYRYYLDGVEVPGVELKDLSAGNHIFQVVDSGDCESEVSFSIGASTSMSVNIIASFTTCENDNGGIEANVSNGSQPYTYDIGQGEQSTNKFTNLKSGIYELVIRDDEGCEISREVVLGNEGVRPRANFRSILNGEEVIFVNTSMGNPQSSEWDFGDGNNSNETNPRHTYEQLGDYMVCLTVVNTCGVSTICNNLNVNGDRDCIANDSLALVALYVSTNGANWSQSWDLQTPINTWFGLTFDPSGCLTRIDLEDNNLIGELPVEIGNFLTLEYMNLSRNSIGAALPIEIGNLLTLETLNLSYNDIIGEIPEEIEGIRRLTELNLSNNQMSGPINSSIYMLSELRMLDLSHNEFSGTLISDLGLLTNLSTLDVSFNEIEGEIPDVWNQLSGINNIYLNDNKFKGSLPASINQIDSLTAFWISNNGFTSIPDMSQHDKWDDIPSKGFRIDQNRLTFKYIIPNMEIIDGIVNRAYSPQDKVYIDTLIQLASGTRVMIDIGVDAGVSDVEYQWFRNGTYLNSNNVPILEIQQAQMTDAGIYQCELVHPEAPELRLVSRNIIMEISTSTDKWKDSDPLKMFPNPVSNGAELFIELSEGWKDEARISIISLDGKLLSSQKLQSISNETRLSIVAPSNPGVYIIKIESGNRTATFNRVVVY